MPHSQKLTCAVICLCAFAAALTAETILFDFEDGVKEWKKAQWRVTLEASTDYPIQGKQGLKFTHPTWIPAQQGGHQTWPAISTTNLPKDWSAFDRLVIPVFNASAKEMPFGFYITDSKTPMHQGYGYMVRIPANSFKQLVLPLKPKFAEKKLNAKDISLMQFFSENPPVPMTLYIDRISLLTPADQVPIIPQNVLKKLLHTLN